MGSRSLSSEFQGELTTKDFDQIFILIIEAQYARIVECERKCQWLEQSRAPSTVHLPSDRWWGLITLHLSLLHEHEQFFVMCQHPSVSLDVKNVPKKYEMSDRMWRYGIYSLLNILRQSLPGSLKYMLCFIETVSSILKRLILSNSELGDSLFEQLGDVARYGMFAEKLNREYWNVISRCWYQKAADRNPDSGRIQHHLGVLSQPDPLQTLFFLTKALISAQPFPGSRVTVGRFFNDWPNLALQENSMATYFIAAHYVLLRGDSTGRFMTFINGFLSLLPSYMEHHGHQRQHTVYVMSCNFASVFGYHNPAFMAVGSSQSQSGHTSQTNESGPANQKQACVSNCSINQPAYPTKQALQGVHLTFRTLSVLLQYSNGHNSVPAIHVSLAFLWGLTCHHPFMESLEARVPWRAITRFLNSLITPNDDFPKIEDASFPAADDGAALQLPEDFLIRGQTWSQLYYPKGFFNGSGDSISIEVDSEVKIRRYRCLWLGVQLAMVGFHDLNCIYFTATDEMVLMNYIVRSLDLLHSYKGIQLHLLVNMLADSHSYYRAP